MSSFIALNIEPDDDSEDEVDNTKEIQIEEALKLYQTALRLHSQGPRFHLEAAAAYAALFESEIFKNPETLAELNGLESSDSLAYLEDHHFDNLSTEPTTVVNGTDSTPNTLPQILFLAYKNRGQFILDSLKHQITLANALDHPPEGAIEASAAFALSNFVEALERDETDVELWRRTSRISGLLGSKRISRYCLESVLDDEDDPHLDGLGPSGLEEGFAGEELRVLLDILSDELSVSQPPISLLKHKRLSSVLKRYMDPYPYLPQPGSLASPDRMSGRYGRDASPLCSLNVSASTWTSLGKTVLQELTASEQGLGNSSPGAGVRITLLDARREGSHEVYQSNVSDEAENQIRLEAAAAPNMISPATQGNAHPQEPSLRNSPSRLNEQIHGVPARDEETTTGPTKDENVMILPSRKRSSTSAGLEEAADAGRIRSKRIRARESVVENNPNEVVTAAELAKQYEEQLQRFSYADNWMFEVVDSSLRKLGVEALGKAADLKQACLGNKDDANEENPQSRLRKDGDNVIRDFLAALSTWNDEKAEIYLRDESLDDPGGGALGTAGSRNAGLAAFFEHFRVPNRNRTNHSLLAGGDGIANFVGDINEQWLHVKQVAYQLLERLLLGAHNEPRKYGVPQAGPSTYLQNLWPDTLKATIVQLLVRLDSYVYDEMVKRIFEEQHRSCGSNADGLVMSQKTGVHSAYADMVETIFELHLDIYASITNPSSAVDNCTRTAQKDRLDRWARITSQLFSLGSQNSEDEVPKDSLSLRYIWAATYHATLTENISREYVLLCFSELKHLLQHAGNPVIELQNNAVMPEISAEAADEEISRKSSMDFFLTIFSAEQSDAVAIIENLEPVLDSRARASRSSTSPRASVDPNLNENDEDPSLNCSPQHTSLPKSIADDHPMEEMTKFLGKGSASLRLFLWRRLREAYQIIDYPPMVFTCYLRAVEIVMNEFKSNAYLESSTEHRQCILLKWIRVLDDALTNSLTLALNEPSAFDCVDPEELNTSMTTIAELARLLHVFALYEDSLRVGHTQPPQLPTHPSMASFALLANKLRDMQMRAWTLQYTMLREATLQNQDLFPAPAEELTEYLRWVHYSMGIRGYCKASNKVFVKLMKSELLTLTKAETWETDMAQVLYDLHGLKLFSNIADLQDHGCTPEPIDRKTAVQIIDFLMVQIQSINIKDLAKTEFKTTIDKMQQVLGSTKPTPAMLHSRRILNAYLRSTINPLDLYRCLQGVGYLSAVPVRANSSIVAAKGWYLLLGHLALAKFRSQKRVSPGPTDDLDIAATFLRQDLEHAMDHWETWYRLAQVYDCKIEEDVLWSAEKLNSNRREITDLQRHSIHCYMMAIATAVQFADASLSTAKTRANMYTDFGMRMYASSRPPFSMEVFETGDFKRHFSGSHGEGMYKERPHRELSDYTAWKFASILFKQALTENSCNWIQLSNHYMLGKCLWKMHNHERTTTEMQSNVAIHEVIDAFVQAIENIPSKRDSRQDPVLEPHYKLVSTVHKLVHSKELTPQQGSDILKNTPYARKTPPSRDDDTWEPYILSILKSLRTADKANWHHRIIARAAHVIYDDSADDITAAMGAKHEFTQQIFTKTLTLQVWKPENERAGRHYVCTSEYVTFFVQLLLQLNDRASLEALVKRVRRRPNDFFRHHKVWRDICHSYLKLLRRVGQVPEGHEDTIFKAINHDEFGIYSSRLEDWCQHPDTASPTLDILRDVVELKRINNNLMKSTYIDDLIVDTYAKLYEMVVPDIVQKMNGEENRERMSLANLMSTDGAADAPNTQVPQSAADPTAKQRVKGVGRRELQRKAEAAVNKPSPLSVTIKPPKPAETGALQQQQTIPAMFSGVKDEMMKEEAQGAGSSVPGSVHDSADDESELSEVDEERIVKPMFPNLVNKDTGSEERADGAANSELD
ncbi:MAG: Histone transcription regulator 3 [Candelina mexicana]|nr:MAG: Histone transcription regulator 3 [Candelina mexicana]